MKTLTLTQPWASLVALGKKHVETRSWRTDYRGPLAIHAAKGFPQWAKDTAWEEPFLSALKSYPGPPLPIGCVLATCRLVACVPTDAVHISDFGQFVIDHEGLLAISATEHCFGDYSPLRWAWLLADIKPLTTPIPAKGSLGLWEWEGVHV